MQRAHGVWTPSSLSCQIPVLTCCVHMFDFLIQWHAASTWMNSIEERSQSDFKGSVNYLNATTKGIINWNSVIRQELARK